MRKNNFSHARHVICHTPVENIDVIQNIWLKYDDLLLKYQNLLIEYNNLESKNNKILAECEELLKLFDNENVQSIDDLCKEIRCCVNFVCYIQKRQKKKHYKTIIIFK